MAYQSLKNKSRTKNWAYRTLVLLAISLLALILERNLLPLPQNQRIDSWKEDITVYEEIFTRQKKLLELVNKTSHEINSFDISVHQVQKEAEIEGYIKSVERREIQSENSLKSSYNIQASNILLLHYEARKQLGATQRNYNQIIKQLEDCRANIPAGTLLRAPYK